jgi:hypothetical protein
MIVVRMSNISKLHFEALHTTGNNYLTLAMDVEMHLATEGNGDARRK